MRSKNVETLKNMNSDTSKFAKWYAHVLDPKVLDYQFSPRGETVNAQKFQCVLVSKDPSQYMQAVVPFNFNERKAAMNALSKYPKNKSYRNHDAGVLH